MERQTITARERASATQLDNDVNDRLTACDLAASAIRLYNDVNGNPRYYIPAYLFWDVLGKGVRPLGAVKYRGKKFGPGWVFQSYALSNDLREAIKQACEA